MVLRVIIFFLNVYVNGDIVSVEDEFVKLFLC